MKKEFEIPKRDGTKAKVVFEKPEDSIWYWDVEKDGEEISLPLPDVNLDNAKTLIDCLKLINEKRGEDWVGQVIVDILKVKEK